MDKYYYFVAQLPFLKFQEKPLISRKDFLLEGRKWLNPKDLKSLASIGIDDFLPGPADCALIKEYKFFERNLRENIAAIRSTGTVSKERRIPENIKRAVMDVNPLEAEVNIFYLRWVFIEDLEKDNFFNLDYLRLYFLKLHILERLAEFDKEKGIAVFDRASESIAGFKH